MNARDFVNSMVAECNPEEVKRGKKGKSFTQHEDDEAPKARSADDSGEEVPKKQQVKKKKTRDEESVQQAIEMEDIEVS